MTCCINGFRPELPWSLVLIRHRPSHLNEGSVLALCDVILLRWVWSRELMCDAQCIKISVDASVLEFCDIVTLDVLDLDAIIGHGTICEASEDILHVSLIENYVHPGVS